MLAVRAGALTGILVLRLQLAVLNGQALRSNALEISLGGRSILIEC